MPVSFSGEVWRWPHFTRGELSCRCAGRFCDRSYHHDPAFLDALEALRERAGRPLVIVSAHRCPQWNARVGGAPLSRHLGMAVDIALSGHERQTLRRQAQSCGFTGLGLGRSFIHLDRRERPAVWFYPGSEELWQM